MTILQQTFTTELVVPNLPTGREVGIQTSADLTIAFWNPLAGAYDATIDIDAPGQITFCPNAKAKLVTADAASVNITLLAV